MQIALPEMNVAATLILDGERPPSDEQFLAFCEANRDLRIERSAKGEICIVPPAGYESDSRNEEVTVQLGNWSRRTKRGRTSGSSTLFRLPDGSALSPDAAWVSNERRAALPREAGKGFLPLCPEFVIEVMSPADRLPAAQQKMRNWIANGAELGWLIDGDGMRVYVFRQNGEVQIVTGDRIEGEGPVSGFTMDLTAIWAGA